MFGLLRFYFGVTAEELNTMSIDDLIELYYQLKYALDFDAIRASGDEKTKLKMPL